MDIIEPNNLQSKVNAEISKKIDALEENFFHEERFQVDRAKLEKMVMSCAQGGKSEADLYFDQIMKTTHTQVEWLQSLRNDINIRKHPYIVVSGRRMEDVTWAKGLILASLEVNNSVFRLKMAISNIDHHFVMGRNNNNINRIMDDTQTHIQFPDPNLVKKGNQVTIHGTLDDLEKARGLLRLSSPILMSFELPTHQPIPSCERVGNYFKVQVMFSASSKPNTLLVLIRGSTRRVDKLKKATRSLLNYAMGKMAHYTIVSVQLEVPPQHQESVKGENCENIIAIMEKTNTKIFFPDLSIRGNRRSQVTITGSIDEVLMARAELVGNFPIELTFDIPTENESATEIMELGRRAGVCITISHKERDTGMSVTIKGSEKSIETIYEIHRSIRHINAMFPFDKYMTNSLNLFDGGYQQDMDSAMDNYVENLVERSETASEECSSEQSPSAMRSPDLGEQTAQDEIKQNNWRIYDPNHSQNAQQFFYMESFESTDQLGQYYLPNQTYQHTNNWIHPDAQEPINPNGIWIPGYNGAINSSYPEEHNLLLMNYQQVHQPQQLYPMEQQQNKPNDWTVCELQVGEEIHHSMNVQQTQAYLQQNNQSIHQDVQNIAQLNFENNNSDLGFENEPLSPTTSKSSPLIIGSEESVASRLICSGWGNLF